MHIDLESTGTKVAFVVTLCVACFHAKPNHCQDQQTRLPVTDAEQCPTVKFHLRKKTRTLKIPVFTRVAETIFANRMTTPSTGLPAVCADSVA